MKTITKNGFFTVIATCLILSMISCAQPNSCGSGQVWDPLANNGMGGCVNNGNNQNAVIGIYSGMEVFIPQTQVQGIGKGKVFSDEGTPANTAGIFNIQNRTGDGMVDYRNQGEPYMSILVGFDINGDGLTDLVTDPLYGIGVAGFPMDENEFIKRKNKPGQGLGTLNGVSGYRAVVQYKNYFCAYAGRSGEQLMPTKYSATLVFLD